MRHPQSNQARRTYRWAAAMSAVTVVAFAAVRPAPAVSVQAKVSAREVIPGEVFQLHVLVDGAGKTGRPKLPPIPGCQMELLNPNPRPESFTRTINGRVVERRISITYIYNVKALRAGRLTIPAITVDVGGKTYKTNPIPINVTKSQTGELLAVEFAANREWVFIEQPFELTLRIWVRPYRGQGIRLKGRQMWTLFRNTSDFGPFAQQIAQGKFTVRDGVLRKDSEGVEREYCLYQATRTVRPEKPGPYRPEPVTIETAYPVRLKRSSFGDLQVAQSRRLAQRAKPPNIIVKPIPQEGRPATYNGAIGRYTWKVWPDRTDVRRGQLITLNMELAGKGLLERVPAPPLAKVPALTERFKVLDEQLAGEVKDDKKVFRQKIRAIDDNAEEIPPIPFVFFDPDADGGQGRFVTVNSKPVPITVQAAEALSAEDIVIPAAMGPMRSSLLTEASDSIRANYTDADAALANQVFAPGAGWAVSLALPPVLWAVGWLIRRRSDRLRTDVRLVRRLAARKNAEHKLRAARDSSAPADGVADALLTYVADRANLPAGGMTRTDAVQRLGEDDAADDLVRQVDELLSECEAARYAGASASGAALVERAAECVKRLERTWKP